VDDAKRAALRAANLPDEADMKVDVRELLFRPDEAPRAAEILSLSKEEMVPARMSIALARRLALCESILQRLCDASLAEDEAAGYLAVCEMFDYLGRLPK
jgi:hypothetical protein